MKPMIISMHIDSVY